MSTLPQYKLDLLRLCLTHRILTFGTFTLKSGRTSPYFFNAGLFNTSSLLSALSTAYAQTIASAFPPTSPSSSSSSPPFDLLFGPAYKGIPLASTVLLSLGHLDAATYGATSYAFNRKEAKAHGEGGNIVGASLKGKKVLVIDDVITAGTAIREAVEIIRREGGEVVGIIVALDRGEKVASEAEKRGEKTDGREEEGRCSTVEMVRREVGVRVEAVLTLEDVIRGLKEAGGVGEEEVRGMEEYRGRYGA
ncbi:phosphoribosyltransferase-like protein [Elsinoe ampelina]|uniref:Orotate phosphoribosyltransferase n=1 Tax=Elsinoe ampelina TaxID=302913 RepID=A0A6A6G9F8_9PEZI|nr:phosphoribosyltransferase-like protein [Elsinoe ampelina]